MAIFSGKLAISPVSGGVPVYPPGLGPLEKLPGRWEGSGFNVIWRPFHDLPVQDRFLELNETHEVLEFVEIQGDIPNRGLLQPDIAIHAVTYLQRINDVNVLTNGEPTGIHVEPGCWLRVPATSNPADPETVVRQAVIPHGTSLVAQGIATDPDLPLVFTPVSIVPFIIGNPSATIDFPEAHLATPAQFRTPAADIPHVTQAMLDNPNTVLAEAIEHITLTDLTKLTISTMDLNPPDSGGGLANIAFLTGTGSGPNALAVQMDAQFWIESFTDASGKAGLQLQYSQRVLLNFSGLSWPHVSVASLVKVA